MRGVITFLDLVGSLILWMFFLTDIAGWFSHRARLLHVQVIRLTPVYLACLPFILVWMMALSDWGAFWKLVNMTSAVFWGWMMWREWKKNRRNKKKRLAKALSRVKQVAGRLVVVPQPVRVTQHG